MLGSKENEGEAGDRSVYTVNTLAPKHFGTTKCDHIQSFFEFKTLSGYFKSHKVKPTEACPRLGSKT